MTTAAMALMEATWPPKLRQTFETYVLRKAEGGGGRVNSASLLSPKATQAQIAEAEAQMRAWGQTPSFLVTEDWQAALLADWIHDEEVLVYAGPCPARAHAPYCASWPATPEQQAVWEKAGIRAQRRAVMEGVEGPKAAISVTCEGQTAGVLFAGVTQGHLVIHAVEVEAQFRRQGLGQKLLSAASDWGQAQGATAMMLVVTAQNAPALALYARMGLKQIGAYHYRIKA